jgi:murein DD-endopeptidase MepM/ murein hydrolase activator NlpD
VAPTTTTLPPDAEPEPDADADVCDPETQSTSIDTNDTGSKNAKQGDESTSTVTTTTTAASQDARDGDSDSVESGDDADIDPCNPPEDDDLGFEPVERIEAVRDIVFPIVGRAGYYDGFGACRDGCAREHHGIDIGTFGWKGLPVVASHDGTVTRTTYDQKLAGCAVILVGDDGWESRYVHLNTDFPGTDTNGYSCLVPGIEVGSEVVAGQIIGYVGDSGNAETTIPHIHFEIRTPSGIPINAYESLNEARVIEFEWLPQDPSAAYNAVVAANYPDTASTAVIVSADEAMKLAVDESAASEYHTPVIVIDESNPEIGLEQISRLGVTRAIVRTDSEASSIAALVAPLVEIVEIESFPISSALIEGSVPDPADEVPVDEDLVDANPLDRFATIIARSADKVEVVEAADTTDTDTTDGDTTDADTAAADEAETRAAHLEALNQFAIDHRTAVLSSGATAIEGLSNVAGSTPSSAEESLATSTKARRASISDDPPTPLPIWWNTGDRWAWADDMADMPDHGVAYLTEAQATPWTLAFLSSVVELDPMPIWRG